MLTLRIKCSRCNGTGIDDNVTPSIPCTSCGGTGYVGDGIIDIISITDALSALQTSIDQVAEVVKEESDYIKKIYEIVSKGKT